nr:MAG TPA: PORTAL PROTEIN, 15 PROTEIN, HEAD PROTEIN, VIRAL INFECTION, TAILED.2A [Caudoviricetes sp.]
MAKTSRQVQGDVYRKLRKSPIAEVITGSVYREGQRPRDSPKEDAVVIFTAGTTGDIQRGVVTINIFVPDIDPYENGVLTEDSARTEEIERAAQRWVDSLSTRDSNYRFRLQQTIATDEAPELHEHFIVVRLEYDFFGDDDTD